MRFGHVLGFQVPELIFRGSLQRLSGTMGIVASGIILKLWPRAPFPIRLRVRVAEARVADGAARARRRHASTGMGRCERGDGLRRRKRGRGGEGAERGPCPHMPAWLISTSPLPPRPPPRARRVAASTKDAARAVSVFTQLLFSFPTADDPDPASIHKRPGGFLRPA